MLFNPSFYMVDLLVKGPGAFDMLSHLAPNSFTGFVPNRAQIDPEVTWKKLRALCDRIVPRSLCPHVGRPAFCGTPRQTDVLVSRARRLSYERAVPADSVVARAERLWRRRVDDAAVALRLAPDDETWAADMLT